MKTEEEVVNAITEIERNINMYSAELKDGLRYPPTPLIPIAWFKKTLRNTRYKLNRYKQQLANLQRPS